jgi:hypothetical protein
MPSRNVAIWGAGPQLGLDNHVQQQDALAAPLDTTDGASRNLTIVDAGPVVRDAISSHEKIRRTIMEFAARQLPAEREAHNLIGKIGVERALELLKAGSGNGAAVPLDAVPPADDPEPK